VKILVDTNIFQDILLPTPIHPAASSLSVMFFPIPVLIAGAITSPVE
jgi:hypothetical protein